MRNPSLRAFVSILCASLLMTGCGAGKSTQAPASTATPGVTPSVVTTTPAATAREEQPVRISGEFTYSNDFVLETYYVEQAVALADMHGFVIRDREWVTPTESQTLGYMKVDSTNNRGSYYVDLPELPRGTFDDVDNNGRTDQGVQIFAVAYWPNFAGGPYSEGDDPSLGWPTYLASVQTDTENKDEVTGGKLLLWAPDGKQQFPTGFGADGLLFTADDPVGPIAAGYSLVDLNQKPFGISRQAEETAVLYEPKDLAIKDFSGDSYTAAFEQMFNTVRKEYAFNGIEGKAPDWDKVYAELAPRVKEAETNQDPRAFYRVIRDFTFAFKDGHVSLEGGAMANEDLIATVSSGYGMAIRIADDGSVIVVYLTKDGPAEKAGIQVGATISSMNGQPIMDAIQAVQPLSAPFSTSVSELYQQARYLTRAPEGTEATFAYTNPKGKPAQAKLKAIRERDSYSFTSTSRGVDPNALPVEFALLSDNVGYIRVNSNYDDLNLTFRLFKRALDTFIANEAPGVIIDMRHNSGGNPLGLAGFFTNQEIPLGQLEYYSDRTGQFEPDGPREKIRPYEEQYSFKKMVLLVGMACYSACEIDAYGLSQVPGMVVMGETPSAGVEAEVARGQYLLPEGIAVQVPTGRFVNQDGSIFLEGQGVQLNRRVPDTAENLLSGRDFVLDAAEKAILLPAGAGMTPSGAPMVAAADQTVSDLQSGLLTATLESASKEGGLNKYTTGEINHFTVELSKSQPLAWLFGYCAKDAATLENNMQAIQLEYTLDGQTLDETNRAVLNPESGGQACRYVGYELTDWPAGEHHLELKVTFTRTVDDGTEKQAKGSFVNEYVVYVDR
jgi:C-terminal processing protease CtpA/Prc